MNKQEKYNLGEGALISGQKQLNEIIQIIIGKMETFQKSIDFLVYPTF